MKMMYDAVIRQKNTKIHKTIGIIERKMMNSVKKCRINFESTACTYPRTS